MRALDGRQLLRMSLRTKLILGFVLVVLVTALVSVVIGTRRLGETILDQAQTKVVHDLAAARLVYQTTQDRIRSVILLTSERFFLKDAVRGEHWDGVWAELERVRLEHGLDYLSVVNEAGTVVVRSRSPYNVGDDRSEDPVVRRALRAEVVVSTEILSEQRLIAEGAGLAERARTKLLATPHAAPRDADVETEGMVLHAAAPILDLDGTVVGVLYGGVLLNRNDRLVDEIRDTVYEGEMYHDTEIGTATIFQWDVRIATNVRDESGGRAIGTRVSEAVYNRVLVEKSSWNDRAFVVNQWYITAYEPIYTATDGRVVGMLYVGMLERPFVDVRNRLIGSIVRDVLIFGVGSALLVAILLARRISKPIRRVAGASDAISRGDFSQKVEVSSGDEIGALGSSFNRMSEVLQRTLKEKDIANEQLKRMNARYLELLGFVTHELMQPLGVIRGYLTLMRDQQTGALTPVVQRQAVESMLHGTDSLIEMSKAYLGLSRIESGELKLNRSPVKLYEDIIRPVADAMRSRLKEKHMRLRLENAEEMRGATLNLDATLMRIVYTNLLDNALKYGKEGGEIVCGYTQDKHDHRLNVWNEGTGIPADKCETVFQKFVRLQIADGEQPGTGLGLSNTKAIIERHGGVVWVESQEGEWANFVILLPREEKPGDGPGGLDEEKYQREGIE